MILAFYTLVLLLFGLNYDKVESFYPLESEKWAAIDKTLTDQPDTMVNYCKLVRAGFMYGEKSTENKASIDPADLDLFNAIWRDVFDVTYYQTGITANEFTTVQRFREGNRQPFPPSSRYNPKNPDTYLLFHIAKEIGKIKSTAYDKCPSCKKESIDKINTLLKGNPWHGQAMQMWIGTSALKTITTEKEITDFWLFLKCMFIDDRIHPVSEPMFINLGPVVRTPDTTFIKCHDEIKPKVTVGYRHCEIGGKTDTIGPVLFKGLPDCPGSIYRFKYVAKDFCNKKDSAYQYFVIKNDPPDISCPDDTIVDCIENLKIRKPSGSSSCDVPFKVTHKKPRLVSGIHNCPYAVYQVEFNIRDTCGRNETCIQKVTIQNDPPKIACPPDTVVECIKYFKKGNATYVASCKRRAEVTTTPAKLVKGKPDCDGSVYEVVYTVKDSCDRKASCTQKITIKNKGPEIECPPNQEVQCFEDIHVGQPKSIKVACDLGYDLKISDPKLIMGKHNCTGAVYSVIFHVTDDCGRTDECEQLFTILQPEVSIQCPPDHTVMCFDDIRSSAPTIKIACRKNYKVETSDPAFISGPGGNCPGTKYGITYTVSDDCGIVKECTQVFTIDNPDPEIVCGPEVIVECERDPDMMMPVPVVSCELDFEITTDEPVLISGLENCDGARYRMTVTVTDECGRTATCEQFFKIRIPVTEVMCAQDMTVECEKDIVASPPLVKTYCDLTFTVDQEGPILIKGKKDCPGAEYVIKYKVTDECRRTVTCTQSFVIDNQPPSITCPPDRIVPCEDDIKPEEVIVGTSCGDDGGEVTGPDLVSGIPGCPNAVYELTYTVIDNCGRQAMCKQRFTLSGDDLQVTCPRDTVVKSKADIRPYTIYARTSCDVEAEYDVDGPRHISGVDDQPGAVYEIIYTIYDECGQRETCVQRFTIIGIGDNCRELCDCYKELKNVPLDLIKSTDQRFHQDVAALIKKYGCKKVKEWAQNGVVELWNAWAAAEILGNETGVATDIARRGNINQVMQNLDNINKVIEILEEAINGEPKKTMEIIAEIIATDGLTYLTGSGTPALVFTSIKSLGEFAKYLNNEILIINLKTLANYADSDPCIFDPDHYLLHYAKIREIKPGDRVTWNDIHNTFRIAIWEFAQHRLSNTNLPQLNEIWRNQQNINLLRTVTYSMLKEACQYWCYKLTLKRNMNKLIEEQSLLMRFRAVLSYINNYDCQGEEKPCTLPNSELVEINGKFICQCVQGHKWDPGKIRCIPFTDCSTIANSIEVYSGDLYECDCSPGYEWNASRTACVASAPDCSTFYPNSHAVLNQQTNVYECHCNTGFEWNTTRTACIASAPDCNTYYPNSHAVLNQQTNVYECHCNTGFEWNTTRTACIASAPDCNAYYPNSHAVLNQQTNVYECHCNTGFEWNTTRTACIASAPDCNAYYPNSHAVLNQQTNIYECHCNTGFEWNTTRTACIASAPDCNAYYPNTIAVWNTLTNKYECNCIQGYVWNSTMTGCISNIPDCNSFYPNSTAIWNPVNNRYECNCITGYQWDGANCVPSGNRDNIVVNPQQQKTGQCNVTYGSGANEPEQYTIDVHATSGSLQFSFDTYTVKDRIHIYYGGGKIFDSGCVGSSGGQTFTLNGSSVFTVIVDPLCDPSESDTQWSFTLGCPQ